jgi:hypothetical protein
MRQATFWAAVVGLAVIAQPLSNLLADSKVGELVPGLRDLNAYATRRNG